MKLQGENKKFSSDEFRSDPTATEIALQLSVKANVSTGPPFLKGTESHSLASIASFLLNVQAQM